MGAAVLAAAMLTAATAGAACSSGTDDRADAEPELTDPAAAVAAAESSDTQDVVAPTSGAGSDQDESGADDGDPADTDLGSIDPRTIPGEIIAEYNLADGECFNRLEGLQSGRRVTITARVGCDEHHLSEVFHTFEIDAPHPSIYPGDDAMQSFALRTCYKQFEAFVGEIYELSVYEIGVFTPTRTNFEDDAARYRGVHCWLYDVDGEPLVGTAAGTAR